MKHSPLCSRDNGKEIFFTATDGTRKWRFVLPRTLLDKACGEKTNETARKTWVKGQVPDILTAFTAGRDTTSLLNNIRIEEIS